jgi:hypothetical protein
MKMKTLIFRAVRTALITLCIITAMPAQAADYDTTETYYIDVSQISWYTLNNGRPLIWGSFTGEATKVTDTLFKFTPDPNAEIKDKIYIQHLYEYDDKNDGILVSHVDYVQAEVEAPENSKQDLLILTYDTTDNKYSYYWTQIGVMVNGGIFNEKHDSTTKALTEQNPEIFQIDNVVIYPGTFGVRLIKADDQKQIAWLTGTEININLGEEYQMSVNDNYISSDILGPSTITFDLHTLTVKITQPDYYLKGDVNKWLNSGTYTNDGKSYSYGYDAEKHGTKKDYTFKKCEEVPTFDHSDNSVTTKGWYKLTIPSYSHFEGNGLYGQFTICDSLKNEYGWNGTLNEGASKYEYFYTNDKEYSLKDCVIKRHNSVGDYNDLTISAPGEGKNVLYIYEQDNKVQSSWGTMPKDLDSRYKGYKEGEYFIKAEPNWWYDDNCSTYIYDGSGNLVAKCNEFIAGGNDGNGVGIEANEIFSKVTNGDHKNFRLAHNYYTNSTIYFNPTTNQVYIETVGDEDTHDLYITYTGQATATDDAEIHGPILNLNSSSINTINYKLDTYGTDGEMQVSTATTGESCYKSRIMPGMEYPSGQLLTAQVVAPSGFENQNTWVTIKGADITISDQIHVLVNAGSWDGHNISEVAYRVYGYSKDGSKIQIYDPTANDGNGAFVDDNANGTKGWTILNRGTFSTGWDNAGSDPATHWTPNSTGTGYCSWTAETSTDDDSASSSICEQNATKYIQLRFKYTETSTISKVVARDANTATDSYVYAPEYFETSTELTEEDIENGYTTPFYMLTGSNKIYTAGTATGIEDIEVEASESSDANSDATVIYYNLQGERIERPTNGIYIRVVDNTATKVAF